VRLAGRKVQSGGSIDGHNRSCASGDAPRNLLNGAARWTGSPGPQHCIHYDARGRPIFTRAEPSHTGIEGESPVGFAVCGAIAIFIDAPYIDASGCERSGYHPTISTVVAVASGYKYTAPQPFGELPRGNKCSGAARGLHENTAGNARLITGALVPTRGLFGVEHRNLRHD
jgi:hypothetical protein